MANLTAIVRSATFVILALALSSPVYAQIYTWRDANGNLVLSNKIPAGKVRSYQTPRASAPFRTTRPAEAVFTDRYEQLISEHSATYGVSPDLVRAVIQVESGFNPRARSNKGAKGLMQLMPATAIEMGVTDPYDPDQNIRGGVAYLGLLLNRYAGDVSKALAAYNAGPGRVDRYGARVPYAETRNYVAQVQRRSSEAVTGAVRALTPGRRNGAATVATPPPPRLIFKTVEIIDGRPVAKYTDSRPASGAYEVVTRR